MQDTLAHEWRRRMAARSSLCAMLLAVPVGVAALIGFSAGPGGLPLGISSLANGPTENAIGVAPSGDRSRALSQIARATTAAAVTVPAVSATGPGAAGPPAAEGGAGGLVDGGGASNPGDSGAGEAGGGGPGTTAGGGTGQEGPTEAPPPEGTGVPPADDATGILDTTIGNAQETLNELLGGPPPPPPPSPLPLLLPQ